jgi:hypothetical protein
MVSHYEEKELQSKIKAIVPILTNLNYFQNTTHQVNAEDSQYFSGIVEEYEIEDPSEGSGSGDTYLFI